MDTDSDSYASFSSEDGVDCAPSPLSDMSIDEDFQHWEGAIANATFQVSTPAEVKGEDLASTEAVLKTLMPLMKGGILVFPETMERYLSKRIKDFLNILASVESIRKNAIMYCGKSLVSTINIGNQRIRVPFSVICDACVFSENNMVMVLTFVSEHETDLSVCKQYNTYLARGITEGFREHIDEIDVVHGVIKEDENENEKVNNLIETKLNICMFATAARMNPSKCKQAIKALFHMVSSAQTGAISACPDHQLFLKNEDLEKVIRMVDFVEPVKETASLLMLMELTCRLARRERTLVQVTDKGIIAELNNLRKYVPLLDTTADADADRYQYLIKITSNPKESTLTWTFCDWKDDIPEDVKTSFGVDTKILGKSRNYGFTDSRMTIL